jgi:glucuronate isomerase
VNILGSIEHITDFFPNANEDWSELHDKYAAYGKARTQIIDTFSKYLIQAKNNKARELYLSNEVLPALRALNRLCHDTFKENVTELATQLSKTVEKDTETFKSYLQGLLNRQYFDENVIAILDQL